MDNYNPEQYSIDYESVGVKILQKYPEISFLIFNSPIETWHERNSIEQTVMGLDFSLKNGTGVDLKSSLGYYKKPRFYDKLVISVMREQNGVWKDCLLTKETDIWLFLSQSDKDTIRFFTLDRLNAKMLYGRELHEGVRGGKNQRYVILDYDDELLKRYDFRFNPVAKRLEDFKGAVYRPW